MTISLSRETIRLMMQSQRMIKKEFGIRIELDDDQMMARVFAYAAQSSSGDLKQCASQLMQQLLPEATAEPEQPAAKQPSSAARIYRGQVLPEKSSSSEANGSGAQASPAPAKNVIYRGRRVSAASAD